MKSTPAVSVRGGPAQARLVPNSLLTKPLPGGAQDVMGTKRALGRENPPSFFSHHSLFPPCALRRGLGTIQPLTDPPSPHKKSGRETLFPIFFWWGGGGDICTQATQLQYYITCSLWNNVPFDPKFVDAGRSLSLGGYSRRAGLASFGNEGSWPRVVYNEDISQ